MSAAATTSTTPPPRGRLPLVLGGIVIALAGVIGAITLWSLAERRHDDTVADFARAPAGCDTTLSFEREGRFLLYVETAGQLDRIDGDCDAVGAFSRGDDTNPAFELAIIGADGEQLPLGGHTGIAYDTDGYVGSSVGSVQIDGPGEYVVRVASAADDFVVAVGTDPDEDAGVLRLGAISLLIGGLVVGGTALVLAALRGDRVTTDGAVVPAIWPVRIDEPPLTQRGAVWEQAAGPPAKAPGIPGEALQPPKRPSAWAPPPGEGEWPPDGQ